MEYKHQIQQVGGKANGYIFSLLSLFVVLMITQLIEGHPSILVVGCGALLIGYLLIRLSTPKGNRSESYRLWVIFYLIYFAFMSLTNFVYVDDPYVDFFYIYDSIDFYSTIDSILRRNSDLEMYNNVLYEARNWKGFGVISWLLGVFAYFLGDVNNIVIQKTQNVFVCGLTIVYLYNIGRTYFSHQRSWLIATSFGLLTHIFVFASAYGRDTHILLFYTIAFYVFLQKWRARNIFTLVLLGIITGLFRLQHGIFFLFIVLGYIFLRVTHLRSKVAAYILGIVGVIVFSIFLFLNMDAYQNETIGKLEHYQEYHNEKFEEASGLTGVVAKLPVAFQPVANMIISQTYPIPPYRVVRVGNINSNQYLKFPLGIAQVYWMIVLIMLVYVGGFRGYWKIVPKELLFAFGIAVALIFAVSIGSYEYRRMLPAYPIVYLTAAICYFGLKKSDRRSITMKIWISLFAIYGVYFLLKGF